MRRFRVRELALFLAPLLVLALLWVRLNFARWKHDSILHSSPAFRAELTVRGEVTRPLFSEDSKLIAAGEILLEQPLRNWDWPVGKLPGDAYVWDVQTGKLLHRLPGMPTHDRSCIAAQAFSADGSLLRTTEEINPAGAAQHFFRNGYDIPIYWDMTHETRLAKPPDKFYAYRRRQAPPPANWFAKVNNLSNHMQGMGYNSGDLGATLSEDYRIGAISNADDGQHLWLTAWDVARDRVLWREASPAILKMKMTRDGSKLYVLSLEPNWEKQQAIPGARFKSVRSPFMELRNTQIRAYNMSTGALLWQRPNEQVVTDFTLSPDDMLLTWRCKDGVQVLRSDNIAPPQTLRVPIIDNSFNSQDFLGFSPDGKTLASVRKSHIYLWDATRL